MNFETDITAAIKILEAGGLILYPTDTIWGIGCDATNEAAVQKIFTLKQRADEKSMIVLLPSERDVIQYVGQPDLAVFDFLETVTKPTTIIYPGAVGLAANLVGADGSIGIRITADPFCRHLLKRFQKPIVSTSANVSGYPPPQIFKDISTEIKEGVDYIVQHRQEDNIAAQPSAVIKWNSDGSHTVLRS